jgi:polysaccharide transporter, PST family
MMRNLIKRIKNTYHMADPNESKRVIRNVLSLSWLQAITYILPIIVLPYLFRVVGPDKFGLIAFAQAFVQYFIILTDYGFSVSATKEISLCHNDKAKIDRVYSAVMTIKILMLIVSFFIMAAIVLLVPKFKNDWAVYALSFGTVIGITLFPTWFFQGIETMKYIAYLNIIGEFIYVVLIFYAVQKPQDYLLIPFVTSCAALLTGVMGQYVACTRFGVSFKLPHYKDIGRQLKAGWNIFISIVAINSYTTTRVFAVGLLTNNTLTGFYSIAERIANVAQTFPLSAFSQAIFPRLSKIYHRNKIKAYVLMKQIQMITVNVSLLCLPVIFLCSPWIVQMICGNEYPEVVASLRFLLVSVFFIATNAFQVQFLLVAGHTKIYSQIHLIMAIIGLPLIILLIYTFSYVGAAMATIVIEGGILAMTYFAVKKLKFS